MNAEEIANPAIRQAVEDPAHQSRQGPLTEYEDEFAEVLESILEAGKHELSEVVAELNAMSFAAPGADAWTEETFKKEMKRLGA